jgi:hypothetical protein
VAGAGQDVVVGHPDGEHPGKNAPVVPLQAQNQTTAERTAAVRTPV